MKLAWSTNIITWSISISMDVSMNGVYEHGYELYGVEYEHYDTEY